MALLGLPHDAAGPVFREPWEAQAFALAISLHQRGVFTWEEWAQVLSQEIVAAQATGDADLGDTYYRHWLCALERLVVIKGVSSKQELSQYEHAWEHAAERTPHGSPIELLAADLHGS